MNLGSCPVTATVMSLKTCLFRTVYGKGSRMKERKVNTSSAKVSKVSREKKNVDSKQKVTDHELLMTGGSMYTNSTNKYYHCLRVNGQYSVDTEREREIRGSNFKQTKRSKILL